MTRPTISGPTVSGPAALNPTVSGPDVLVLGEANPDLILRGDVVPRFGQAEQLLTSAELVLGGSGAITAHALARLGVPTALLAQVGADLYGAQMRSLLAAAGVDVSTVVVGEVPTGLTVVLSDGGGVCRAGRPRPRPRRSQHRRLLRAGPGGRPGCRCRDGQTQSARTARDNRC